MRANKFFVLLILLLICFNNLFAQSKFFVGPQVGFSAPSGDYGGTTLDYYAGKKYGLSFSFDLGVEFKAVFGTGYILNLHSAANYSVYHNTGQATSSGQGSIDIKSHVLTFSAGPEFALPVPESPVKPYVNLDLLVSSISGEVSFLGVPESVPSGTYDVASALRFGLGISFGIQYKLSPKYGLDLTLSYNTLNLFGKKFEDADPSADNRVDSYRSLNDGADPLYSTDENHDKHFIGTNRTITIVQANVAFLFAF